MTRTCHLSEALYNEKQIICAETIAAATDKTGNIDKSSNHLNTATILGTPATSPAPSIFHGSLANIVCSCRFRAVSPSLNSLALILILGNYFEQLLVLQQPCLHQHACCISPGTTPFSIPAPNDPSCLIVQGHVSI